MGFNPTFYAGRPKISDITIDSDLDMGGRNILRVGRVDSPYTPETWPTEELDWGDTDDTQQTLIESAVFAPLTGTEVEVIPAESVGKKVTISMTCTSSVYLEQITLKIGGSVVESGPSYLLNGHTHTFAEHIVNAGDNVSVSARPWGSSDDGTARIDMIKSGFVIGPKTFDLTGKWLALGIDMKGLAATVKIQGVEMPYEDYVKYFPIAPTELKIPGGWSDDQVRPVIEVYK